jgi:ATP-dependent RNA helicase DHX37/DHR1
MLQGLLVKYGGPTFDPQNFVILPICKCISKKNVGWFTILILQLSKAGLDVPEELSLFKRSSDKKISENSAIVDQILPAEFVEPAKSEDPCGEHKNNIKNDSMKAMECHLKMDVEVSIPEPKTEKQLYKIGSQ